MAIFADLPEELVALILEPIIDACIVDTVIEYELYRTARVSRQFYNHISPCLYTRLESPTTSRQEKLLIRTLKERPDLAGRVLEAKIYLETFDEESRSDASCDHKEDEALNATVLAAYNKLSPDGWPSFRETRILALRCVDDGKLRLACILLMLSKLKHLIIWLPDDSDTDSANDSDDFFGMIQDATVVISQPARRVLPELETIAIFKDEGYWDTQEIQPFLHLPSLKEVFCENLMSVAYGHPHHQNSVEVLKLCTASIKDWDSFMKPFQQLKSLILLRWPNEACWEGYLHSLDEIRRGMHHVKETLENFRITYRHCNTNDPWFYTTLRGFPRLKRVCLPLVALTGKEGGASSIDLADSLPSSLEELTLIDESPGELLSTETSDPVHQMIEFVRLKKTRFLNFHLLVVEDSFGELKALQQVCLENDVGLVTHHARE